MTDKNITPVGTLWFGVDDTTTAAEVAGKIGAMIEKIRSREPMKLARKSGLKLQFEISVSVVWR